MAHWKHCPAQGLAHEGPALFLDRDGVVIVDKDYLGDPAQVQLIPGAAASMRAAGEDGYLLVGVSNQSGLGRGLFSTDDLARVMTRMDELLTAAGTGLDGFYYCPHAPGEQCACRKPAPGLFHEAGLHCRWDPTSSWMVGDKASDIAFGRHQGLGAVLVRTGYGSASEVEVSTQWGDDPRVLIADDLPSAYAAIRALEQEGAAR